MERHQLAIFENIASSLPAMMMAVKLQNRAVSVGFDWPFFDQVINKLHEETEELKTEWDRATQDQELIKDEIGDILFW